MHFGNCSAESRKIFFGDVFCTSSLIIYHDFARGLRTWKRQAIRPERTSLDPRLHLYPFARPIIIGGWLGHRHGLLNVDLKTVFGAV